MVFVVISRVNLTNTLTLQCLMQAEQQVRRVCIAAPFPIERSRCRVLHDPCMALVDKYRTTPALMGMVELHFESAKLLTRRNVL